MAAIAAGAASIEGNWRTDDGKAIIAIGHCGATLCGRIAKVLDTGPGVLKTDIHNPDVRLRDRPIKGLPILFGFREQDGTWIGGRAYDPGTGKSYRARLQRNQDGSLKVTGCILLICQSQLWTRVP
jgi:uncharacterized protein (DUF2147 family)